MSEVISKPGSDLAHTVSVTPANVPDVSQLPKLLREDDRAAFGDKGYMDNRIKRAVRRAGVFWGRGAQGERSTS